MVKKSSRNGVVNDRVLRGSRAASLITIALSIGTAALVSGCNVNLNLIDHVVFTPSSNLETVTVGLVFTNTIQTTLSGSYEIGDYGYLFVDPYTPAAPFELGFTLNTNIVNDQNYVKLTPTEVLPNGLPIGLTYALVQIQDEHPISSAFDLYGYVDVLHQSWLGAAAMFSFINNQYFPNGLSISEVFLRDSAGNPGVIASVFGPVVNASGTMTQAGGIALFANVKQLITEGVTSPSAKPLILRPEAMPILAGPRAAEYNGQYTKLRGLESNLVRAFNTAR